MTGSRLLVLATYPRRAASTRFRACAYFDALTAAGIEVDFRPFMTDGFMAGLYGPGRSAEKGLKIAAFTARRFADLLSAGRWSAVFVQREAMPVGPGVIEWFLSRVAGIPLIVDIDDAVWMEQPGSRHPVAARLLRYPTKTGGLFRRAATVITGTEHLADHARRACAHVTVLPTVVSAATWRPRPGRLDGVFTDDAVPTIGWVGTHSTAAHLDLALPALAALAASGRKFRLRLVGASREIRIPNVEIENVPWSESREIEDFRSIDVGIAPVVNDAWSQGKCGFKQVQYMTVGVPFVSSDVGGAREFVVHGENGFFARSTEEWTAHIATLLDDPSVRARFSRAGRALVESRLSVEAQAPVLVDLVRRVIAGSARGVSA